MAVSAGGLATHLRQWDGRMLDKREQCSDWRARPLSDSQVLYAAADAACLLALYDALMFSVAGDAALVLPLAMHLSERDFVGVGLSVSGPLGARKIECDADRGLLRDGLSRVEAVSERVDGARVSNRSSATKPRNPPLFGTIGGARSVLASFTARIMFRYQI